MSSKLIHILLVEDQTADVKIMQRLLSESDSVRVRLDTAGRLQEALEILKKEKYDVILLDLSLPDSEGMETLTYIQKKASASSIIVMTGRDDETFALEALNQGAQDYVIKGEMGGKLLIRVILYAIERKRLLQEKNKLILDLQGALLKIETLSGLIPICSSCKKVRDDKGYWEQVEVYVQAHAQADAVSGNYCPACVRKLKK